MPSKWSAFYFKCGKFEWGHYSSSWALLSFRGRLQQLKYLVRHHGKFSTLVQAGDEVTDDAHYTGKGCLVINEIGITHSRKTRPLLFLIQTVITYIKWDKITMCYVMPLKNKQLRHNSLDSIIELSHYRFNWVVWLLCMERNHKYINVFLFGIFHCGHLCTSKKMKGQYDLLLFGL